MFLQTFVLSSIFITVTIGASSDILPNIILILTDDQDIALHGMFPLQHTRKLLGEAGATFQNAFTNTPLCCPARASLLMGMYAHNHGTTNNTHSGGCNGNKWKIEMEPRAFPALLKDHGYQTFYAGKYLNEYKGANIPPGWDEFYGLHGNSRYYNFTLRENAENKTYRTEYLTDLLLKRCTDFLNFTLAKQQPLFAMISPPAPHAPFTPAPRHKNVFADIKALRTPNFNQLSDATDKHWLLAAARKIPQSTLKIMDKYFQQRWETLLAVDELVLSIVKQLEVSKQLTNSYIIYTSDNGYHIGQFAQPFDKRQPYETDIRVPLLVRGPGISPDISVTTPVSLIDIAPTILSWAKLQVPSYMDGRAIDNELTKHVNDYNTLLVEEHKSNFLVEYWGEGNFDTYNADCPGKPQDRLAHCTPEADCQCQDSWNNTYACVRDFRYRIDRIYCRFRDNENFVEIYDLNNDPYQMKNLVNEILPIEQALYDLALNNLTNCIGTSCHHVHI